MLDVDGLRGHVTTDLDDEALGLLLDAAYEAIDAYAGTGAAGDYPASLTELISPGPGDLLMLSRPAAGITSVIECDSTLAADDYELIGAQMLRRLTTGTHPSSRWRGRVQPTYEPKADENERDRVAIALVNLDVNHSPGLVSEKLGDWAETHASGADGSYAAQRADILASLHPGFLAV